MALKFGEIFTKNPSLSSDFNNNEKLKVIRDFVEDTLNSLKQSDYLKSLPQTDGTTKQVIGSNKLYLNDSNGHHRYAFNITSPMEDGGVKLAIQVFDKFDSKAGGSYKELLSCSGTYKDIHNDLASLRPEMFKHLGHVDTQIEVQNVIDTAKAVSKLKYYVQESELALKEAGELKTATETGKLATAVSFLNKALSSFGKANKESKDLIYEKTSKGIQGPKKTSVLDNYGTVKEVKNEELYTKENFDPNKSGKVYRLDQNNMDLTDLRQTLKQFGDLKQTLQEHIKGNKLLDMASAEKATMSKA